MECKDCRYLTELKTSLDKTNSRVDTLQDKVHVLETKEAVTSEQINNIFSILTEIKNSIQVIATKIENTPSLEEYTKRFETMEDNVENLKNEEGKTYKHIKVAIVTALLCSACTFLLTKLMGG